MSGGGYLDIVLQTCKSWLFEFLAKLAVLLGVKGIGVFLNVYIQRKGIDWSIKGLMILSTFTTTCG